MTVTHEAMLDGYHIREMAPEDFRPFFAENRPRMFGGDFSCRPEDYLSAEKFTDKNSCSFRAFNSMP